MQGRAGRAPRRPPGRRPSLPPPVLSPLELCTQQLRIQSHPQPQPANCLDTSPPPLPHIHTPSTLPWDPGGSAGRSGWRAQGRNAPTLPAEWGMGPSMAAVDPLVPYDPAHPLLQAPPPLWPRPCVGTPPILARVDCRSPHDFCSVYSEGLKIAVTPVCCKNDCRDALVSAAVPRIPRGVRQ